MRIRIPDGEWLFRFDADERWRLITIADDFGTAKWIAGEIEANRLKGHWRRASEAEVSRCEQDEHGRLIGESDREWVEVDE